jgi:hypothetical protein
MPLNVEGEKIQKFGRNLPTPYMEKIKIYENRMSVQISIYVSVNIGEEETSIFKEYESYLYNSLSIYIVNIADFVASTVSDAQTRVLEDERGESGTRRFERLESGTKSVFELLYSGFSSEQTFVSLRDSQILTGTYKVSYPDNQTFHQKSFSELMSTGTRELLYDSSGNPYYRYVMEMEIGNQVEAYPEYYADYLNLAESNIIQEANMACFSTNMTTEEISLVNLNLNNNIVNAIKTRHPATKLLETKVSDISYEQIAKDGKIKNGEYFVFVDDGGLIVSDSNVIIQAIDGTYHRSTSTKQSIVSTFKQIIGTTSDEDLQNMLDQLNYILEVYGTDNKLLQKMNQMRKSFTETSTATPVGRFYEVFERTLFNTNNAVVRGTPLKRQLNVSPVLIDLRPLTSIEYNAPSWDESYNPSLTSNFIYVDQTKYITYIDQIVKIVDPSDSMSPLYSINEYLYGFWLFDYEKALISTSNISKIFDIKRMQQLLSISDKALNGAFKLDSTNIMRGAWTKKAREEDSYRDRQNKVSPSIDNYNSCGEITTYYSYDNSEGQYPLAHSVYVEAPPTFGSDNDPESPALALQGRVPSPSEAAAELGEKLINGREDLDISGIDLTDTDSEEFTYCILRSFNTTNTGSIESGGLNGYRLMCFEHQECAGPFSISESGREDVWSTSFLRYKVSIVDNTLSIYESIIKNYKKLIDGDFEDYYQTAIEQCSYNNTDGFFNDFFVTGATESYSDSPHMAPWHLMPIVYYMHRELVFNEFNGDMASLYAAATADTEAIAPDTGTIGAIESFRDKINSLYTSYYASTDIPSNNTPAGVAAGLKTDHSIVFGDSPSVTGFESIFQPLPETINLSISPDPDFGKIPGLVGAPGGSSGGGPSTDIGGEAGFPFDPNPGAPGQNDDIFEDLEESTSSETL